VPFRLRHPLPVAHGRFAGQPIKLLAQYFGATVKKRRNLIPQLAKRLIGQRSEGRPGKTGTERFFLSHKSAMQIDVEARLLAM
jgi:hypothetical protein